MREFKIGSLHGYDTGGDGLPVLWHHGTPNIGTPPAPLLRPDLRWISYDRPGYGGSTPDPGRDLGSAAGYATRVADELGLERFAVAGHSGGSSHALACAAQLTDRIMGVVAIAALAPFDAEGLDWFAGMGPAGVRTLRAAAVGRTEEGPAAETGGAGDGIDFTAADWAMFDGPWAWFSQVVEPALAGDPEAQHTDDRGYVSPWRCDPAAVTAPTLLLHGDEDLVVPSAHSEWLATRVPGAELRITPGDGHISVLNHAPTALDWLVARAS
ncbi:alpha/beta hydrolase [Actinoplanes sp. NPDC051475]|uniref:alpha/beta fold hydrolase n=1 Tax=Actinoplanes sp. NPDC051475 TaxID=3157225 RepID=UPI00344F7B15